ncbi:MAG: hypothetical protein J6Q15_03155, partial [Clostridia bacterium]|nr:hypothetical protein [Clostridia bacterium]
VGDAGEHKFVAIYTPNNINYNVVEKEAIIVVAKKQLIFNITQNIYTYDMEAHNIKYVVKDLNEKVYNDLVVNGNNARINAGIYNITLNIESSNYVGTKSVELVINKARPIPSIPTNLTATYLDTIGSVMLPTDDEGKWSWSINTNTFVGEVGVHTFPAIFVFNELDGCDNYEDYTTELNVNVVAKSVDIPHIVSNTAIYTGEAISATIPSSQLYKVTKNGWTEVGEHNIELTLNDNKNYIWGNGDKAITNIKFYITKAHAVITGLSLQGWTYGDKVNTPSASTNFGEIVYSYTSDKEGLNIIEKPTNAGTYYVKAEVTGNNNYNGDVAILAFVIAKKDVDVPSPKAEIYTGDNICASIDESSLYTVLENNGGTNKGTYNVVLEINDFDNYKWLNKETQIITITFEIVAAVNDWKVQPEINGWVYNTAHEGAKAEPYFGTVVITYKQQSEDDSKYTLTEPITVGSYIAKFRVEGTDDYNALDVEKPFIISRAEIATPTITSKPYTGSEQSSGAEGTELYEVTTDTKGTEAGSYPVVYTIIDGNYKWKDIETASTTVMFEITKSSAIINSVTMSNWTYGGTASTPSADTNGFGEVEYTYSTSENGTYTETRPSDAGTYYVKATIAEDAKNYYGVSKTKSFTIIQAQAEITGLTMGGWTYSQTASTPNLSVSEFVSEKDIEYKYSTNNKDWVGTKPSDAGKYWVKAIVNTVNNYVGCESSAQSFTILQSSTTINLPTYGTIYMNADDRATYPVTATNVSGGVVDGNWVYGDINYVDGEGASSFSLEFKPKSSNYLPSSTTASITVKSVAVIGSTYYSTIENALAMANSGDTVYVYPDNTGKVVIANPCEIREGATLVLLYGNSTTNGSGRNSTGEEQVHGKDYNNYAKAVLTNLVIVNNGITITNNGTLEIAGELSGSGGGQPYVGHTARNYAELRLGEGATINSQGTINCTGYINEVVSGKSQINANSGSVYLPFIMRDFKGGTYMKAVYDSMETTKVSPFNQFQFRNISSKLHIKNGATLIGYANIYAGSQPNHANINLIGSTDEYLIKFTDSLSYVDAKYNPSNQEYADICELDFYGGMKLNALLLKISAFGLNVSINTSKVFFPLNWAFDVSLNKAEGQTTDAVYDLQQKLKMMPGSRITIGAGAKAIFSELNIYDSSYQDTNTYPTPLYPTKGSAELIVYGTMEVNTVGGNIHAGGNGAVIDIKSTVGITTQETTLELIEEGWLIFKTTKAQYKEVPNASVKLYYNNQLSDIQVIAAKYVYNNGWALVS